MSETGITVTAKDMQWAVRKVAEAPLTWNNFNGFTAETCSDCGARVNVLAHAPGWFCPCGHFNLQSWSYSQVPWALPKYGPSKARLMLAALVTSIWVWAVPQFPRYSWVIPADIRKQVCHRVSSSCIDHNKWFGGVRKRFWGMVTTPLRDLYWAIKTPVLRCRHSLS